MTRSGSCVVFPRGTDADKWQPRALPVPFANFMAFLSYRKIKRRRYSVVWKTDLNETCSFVHRS